MSVHPLVPVVVVAAVCASCIGSSSHGATSQPGPEAGPAPVVGCDQMFGRTPSPFANGRRRVLGVGAAPAAYTPQVARTPDEPWPYWQKAPLIVHAGRAPVDVTVPVPWRSIEAVTWGNGQAGVGSLRIAACASSGGGWDEYPGGFMLVSRSACVPLVFQVGGRRTTVWFGVGRPCGAG